MNIDIQLTFKNHIQSDVSVFDLYQISTSYLAYDLA